MLQTNLSTVFEEGLKVLVIVVQIIFITEELFNHLRIGFPVFFHFFNIIKSTQTTGDGARGKGIAFLEDAVENHRNDAVAKLAVNRLAIVPLTVHPVFQ